MDYPKTVPGVGLVDGKFTDGNAAAGLAPSLDPSEWANAVTDEILNVQAAAGLDPDETKTDQLIQALRILATGYAPDTGAANAYAIALPNAPTPLPTGFGVTLIPAHSNTGPSTLAVNGGAATAIQLASAALDENDLVAGAPVRLTLDAAGNWQLVSPIHWDPYGVGLASSQTWTVPAGVYRIKVTLIGGGGGGGYNGAWATGGGAAGGKSIKWIDVVPGMTFQITIGAGGNAPNTGGNVGGGTGGTTVFADHTGTTIFSATGGTGGGGVTNGPNAGGQGGIGIGGDVNIQGSYGGDSIPLACRGGDGGGPGNGRGTTGLATGLDALGYGGGGGGGGSQSPNAGAGAGNGASGGKGFQGICIIEWVK